MRQPVICDEIILSLNKWKKSIAETQVYVPYLTVRDVNKVGRRHWIYCPRQNREVHLLSDGELGAYKILLWQPSTISVEEQFALDVDETYEIAVSENILHPRDWKKYQAHIMSTDFVVKIRLANGSYERIAYTFKYWDQLYRLDENGRVIKINPRTWQKFNIERIYWLNRGVVYRVITERDTTKPKVWNINYFELAYDLIVSNAELIDFGGAFIESWKEDPFAELQVHLNSSAKRIGDTFQRTQSLFQYTCLHQMLRINTTRHIRLFRPVEVLF
ncbi:TnsA endonuclease N-terminal domain-containing protein [Amphritea sp.]|uniref:TnsA endonuclease N-terminal domain-containing protein n=1 Tax=Amphritea sp. TaxID=1872502 RepID=UPI003A9396C6